MKKIVLYFLCLVPIILCSTTWNVIQDGTGDFTTIVSAVEAANSGDTILIHEGIYYEEIVVYNKPLTYASLFHIDGDESHIGNTVLDGEHSHPFLASLNQNYWGEVNVIGLTFRNGHLTMETHPDSDFGSGGLSIKRSVANITDCSFYNNKGISGGALWLKGCEINLAGNSVRHNQAEHIGGGILAFNDMTNLQEFNFDSINLNSFYNNTAMLGFDIRLKAVGVISPIYADTLSINSYDHYANAINDDFGQQLENYTVQSNHYIIDRVQSDLYVSPSGDDSNDGLTPETPLKSIWLASAKIEPSPSNPLTIHLLPGEYSHSANGNRFPIDVRDNCHLIGSSMEDTIINLESETSFILSGTDCFRGQIKNLSILNGYYGEDIWRNRTICIASYIGEHDYFPYAEFENIHFNRTQDFYSEEENGSLVLGGTNGYIKSCIFGSLENEHLNNSRGIILFAMGNLPDYTFRIEGCEFYNMKTGAIAFGNEWNYSEVEIVNNLFQSPQPLYEQSPGEVFNVYVDGLLRSYIVNNTFSGYHLGNQMRGMVTVGTSTWETIPNYTYIYNNIFEENLSAVGNRAIIVDWYQQEFAAEVEIGNNLIVGGENEVGYSEEWSNVNVNYATTNIDTIPHFNGYGKNALMLDDCSPAIDRGTLNLPDGFVMPDTDIAGNPRVHNRIDLGCYEWQGNVADFTMQAMGNVFPIDVVFTPHYNDPIDTIAWDLDLDGVIDSYEMNPVWSYPDFNGHNVGMYINDGEAIEIKYDCIQPTTPILEETNDTPEANELLACYPNPVRISTGNVILKYNAKDVGSAELKVFNIKGQMVKYIKVKSQRQGRNTIFWYLTDNRGVHVPSGVYLYNLEQNGERIGKGQITVLK